MSEADRLLLEWKNNYSDKVFNAIVADALEEEGRGPEAEFHRFVAEGLVAVVDSKPLGFEEEPFDVFISKKVVYYGEGGHVRADTVAMWLKGTFPMQYEYGLAIQEYVGFCWILAKDIDSARTQAIEHLHENRKQPCRV